LSDGGERKEYDLTAAVKHHGATMTEGHYTTVVMTHEGETRNFFIVNDYQPLKKCDDLRSLHKHLDDSYILVYNKSGKSCMDCVLHRAHECMDDTEKVDEGTKVQKPKGQSSTILREPKASQEIFQEEVKEPVKASEADYETCELCRDATVHQCKECEKPVCNFCTEADGDQEMHRRHKAGDRRCTMSEDKKISKQIANLQAKKSKTPAEKKELARLRKQKQRATESQEVMEKRRDKDRQGHETTRGTESQEVMEKRRDKDRQRHETTRGTESQEVMEKRRDKDRQRHETTRGTEEPAVHKKARLDRNRQRMETARGTEEPAVHKEARLDQNRQRKETARGTEEPAVHKKARQKKDRQRKEKAKVKAKDKKEHDRFQDFNNRTRWGPIYPCICCHQTLYKYQVTNFDEKVEETLRKSCLEGIFEKTVANPRPDLFLHITKEGDDEDPEQVTIQSGGESCFVCHCCLKELKRGSMPARAASNSLAVISVPESVQLMSYLEEGLIARVLLFMKIFSLRTSLMPAVKDKCIVIPMQASDINSTVESLPRLPSETGIIDIQWKRRIGQKNAHLQAKVDPDKIFRALKFLRAQKNPFYQNIRSRSEYEARCLLEDPEGYNLIFSQEDEDKTVSKKLKVEFHDDILPDRIHDLSLYQQILEENQEEAEFREKDVVRKWQHEYDENICMVEKYPEAMQTEGVLRRQKKADEQDDEETNQLHIVAPGEGKTPINILQCNDYEAKAFPMLFPDGRNHLTDEGRQKKINDLMYFQQRLFNNNARWRKHPHWIFSAALYRENKELQRNINLGFKKGKKQTNAEGKVIYTLNEPFSVFQNMANTPAYHKKGKMELMARLDNFGPFHVFFTVSCADSRWLENLTSVLREKGIGLRCIMSCDQKNAYEVQTSRGDWIPIEDYRDNEMDENMHRILSRNVVTGTRNYQARVDALMQKIIVADSFPLCVKHYSTKLEFQARGAGHHHGTLWLDIDRIEQKVDVREFPQEDEDVDSDEDVDHHLKDPVQVRPQLDKFLTAMGRSAGNENEEGMMTKTIRILHRLEGRNKMRVLTDEEQLNLSRLQLLHPLYGLKEALRKVHKGWFVTHKDLGLISRFVDTFCTVSLHPAIVGSTVAAIAKQVNQHHHSRTCTKNTKKECRFNMPKVPSYETIITKPLPSEMSPDQQKTIHERNRVLINKVKEVVKDKKVVEAIMERHPKIEETSADEARKGRARRIDAVLEKAGLCGEAGKRTYRNALAFSPGGYTVVMARDIDEQMVNNYNPEITKVWDGNTDFQICLDFFAIITYISEYYAKDDTGLVKTIVNALKESKSDDLKDKMRLLKGTWLTNRQMGEAEAVYKLTRMFRFRDSDAKCVFLQTCKRSERSKILMNAKERPELAPLPKVAPDFHTDGVYVEQYDINSKYERRPCEGLPILKHLCQAQFVKMYSQWWGNDKAKEENEEDGEDIESGEEVSECQEARVMDDVNEDSDVEEDDEKVPTLMIGDEKFQRVMAYGIEEGEGDLLPKYFKLNDPFPGEPPFMKLRTRPAVLRMHKFKEENNPEGYWLSEAMLYLPYTTEENLEEQIDAANSGGEEALNLFREKISKVKKEVMEYLQDTEVARMMAEQAEQIIDNALTGELMDAEGEQDNEDNMLDDIEAEEQFAHLDPEQLEAPDVNAFEKEFRPIQVRPLEQLRPVARMLDFNQRQVLELAIRHARGLVKARNGLNPAPTPPLCMVDGAAGAGKSNTINIMKEFLQLILQQPGDNLEQHHVMLCAPTGTAAVNIKGQTLHSGLGLSFGDQHYSLADQTRDKKRTQFQNICFLIIDEISMVKADQLYQLDLRLRELKFEPNKPFGGVALFFFGDIMQLQPVKGTYIWCEPKNNDYLTSFLVHSLWEQFTVISLVENHRQQKDKEYADMLNRIRVGQQTDEDIQRLQERVVNEDHPDIKEALVIACKHVSVNKYNSESLERITKHEIVIDAINSHSNLPNFKPKIDAKKNTVDPTPYMQRLRLKIGCRVMLVVNLDILDCLSNGLIGRLRAVRRDKRGNVQILMVEFDNKDAGMNLRREHPHLTHRYKRCTPIMKVVHKYSTSKSKSGVKANIATVNQFPIILSFASTCHKIQGATIAAPQKAAIDLRTVFGPNQAYVMLGRTQSLEQVIIIGSFDEDTAIKTSPKALAELESMIARSLNKNPPVWQKKYDKSAKIFFHNIHSLRDKMDDLREDPIQAFADVIILGETWLHRETTNADMSLHIEGTSLHLNNMGHGKGLAVYVRGEKFVVTDQDVNSEHLQMTVIRSKDLTVVGLYRSQQDHTLPRQLSSILEKEEGNNMLVIGDFNITSAEHETFKILTYYGFYLLDNRATHFGGGHAQGLAMVKPVLYKLFTGGRLDQAWLRSFHDGTMTDLQLYSPYYNCKGDFSC
jgi:hypothetical protein